VGSPFEIHRHKAWSHTCQEWQWCHMRHTLEMLYSKALVSYTLCVIHSLNSKKIVIESQLFFHHDVIQKVFHGHGISVCKWLNSLPEGLLPNGILGESKKLNQLEFDFWPMALTWMHHKKSCQDWAWFCTQSFAIILRSKSHLCSYFMPQLTIQCFERQWSNSVG